MGDKRRQGGRQTHDPTKGNKKGHKGRQDLGKAEAPSNTGTHVGRQWEARPREGEHTIQQRHTYVGRQGETRPREGGHTIQHRHTCGETRGQGLTSGRRAHLPTQAHTCGDNGTQWETRGDKTREGGHTIQERETRRKVLDGVSAFPRSCLPFSPVLSHCLPACAPVFGWCVPLSPIVPPTCVPVLGSRGLVSPCLPLSRMLSPHVCLDGVSAFSRSFLATRGEKTSGRQRHHPTQAHMRGDNERQREAMGDKTSGRSRFAPRIFSFPRNLFPLQCRINSLAICSMLNLEAVISTIFANFGTTSTVLSAFWSKKLMVSQALQS